MCGSVHKTVAVPVHNPEMPVKEAALQALRLRYNAAHAAYQSCVCALSEARIAGHPPSAEPLARVAKALSELTEARQNLLGAMIQVANGHPVP